MRDAEHHEVIATIDDAIVRRLVRVAVHVRDYLPYYAATVAFAVVLLLVPIGGGSGGQPDLDAANAAGAAGPDSPAAAGGIASGAATLTAPALDGMPGPLYGDLDVITADGSFGPTTDFAAGAGDPLSPPSPPTMPTTPSFDPPAPVDEPCTVRPGSPAPVVTPSREAESAQNTAEAAAGVEAPVEAGDVTDTAADTAGCPDAATDVVPPAPPLPVSPVSSPSLRLPI